MFTQLLHGNIAFFHVYTTATRKHSILSCLHYYYTGTLHSFMFTQLLHRNIAFFHVYTTATRKHSILSCLHYYTGTLHSFMCKIKCLVPSRKKLSSQEFRGNHKASTLHKIGYTGEEMLTTVLFNHDELITFSKNIVYFLITIHKDTDMIAL